LGLLDNAEYWIAVSYGDEGRFDEAILHYRKAQDLPDGNKAGAAQYELALSYLKMGDTTHAVTEFYKVVSMYPSEGLAEKTFAKLDSLKSNIQANIPTRGPMTPGLAGNAIAPQTSAQTRPNNANVPQTGPLAGAELPVAKRVIPSEQPATQPAQATQAKPETSQAKINQPAQTAPAPAQKPVQQNAQPAKTVAPANDDPRSLIRPEDKRGI
jgi:tetratricopeptide (TPR) repeat protein